MNEIILRVKTWQEIALSLIEQITLLEIRVKKLEQQVLERNLEVKP